MSALFFYSLIFFRMLFSILRIKEIVDILLEKKYSLSETKKLMSGFIVLGLIFLGGVGLSLWFVNPNYNKPSRYNIVNNDFALFLLCASFIWFITFFDLFLRFAWDSILLYKHRGEECLDDNSSMKRGD